MEGLAGVLCGRGGAVLVCLAVLKADVEQFSKIEDLDTCVRQGKRVLEGTSVGHEEMTAGRVRGGVELSKRRRYPHDLELLLTKKQEDSKTI